MGDFSICTHKGALVTQIDGEMVSVCQHCGNVSPFSLDDDTNLDALVGLVGGANKAIKHMKSHWND